MEITSLKKIWLMNQVNPFYCINHKGVPTFFPPKIPAKPFLYWGRSGKRSNSGKAMSEKRLSVPYRRAFHRQDTFFAGSRDQDPHGKSLFFLSGSSCIPEDAFLSGYCEREECWDASSAPLATWPPEYTQSCLHA